MPNKWYGFEENYSIFVAGVRGNCQKASTKYHHYTSCMLCGVYLWFWVDPHIIHTNNPQPYKQKQPTPKYVSNDMDSFHRRKGGIMRIYMEWLNDIMKWKDRIGMCALNTARFTEDDTTNSTLLIVNNSHLTAPLITGLGHHFIKHVANYKYLANLL